MKNRVKAFFHQAPLPAVLTILAMLFFHFFYYLVTAKAVEPYYIPGLGFLLPFICYLVIHKLTARKHIGKSSTITVSIIVTLILSILMLFLFLLISVHAATSSYNNPQLYKRTLKVNGYPNNITIEHFPASIPNDAENLLFHYNPAFMQGGEIWSLRFISDPANILAYKEKFTLESSLYHINPLWKGIASSSTAIEYGIFQGTFSYAGYDSLPDDFTIYLFNSKPYKQGNWNHGTVSLCAISTLRSEIIFYSSNW